jgi:hypothetical protein
MDSTLSRQSAHFFTGFFMIDSIQPQPAYSAYNFQCPVPQI